MSRVGRFVVQARMKGELVSFIITLPLTKKTKAKERRELLRKMKSLVERDKESLFIKSVKSDARAYSLSLKSEEFECFVWFAEPIRIDISVNKMQKNLNRVNNLANKIVNYLRTIMGKLLGNGRVMAVQTGTSDFAVNIAKKFVDESRLVRINELTKRTLEPLGICFRYESNKHENVVTTLQGEDHGMQLVMTTCEEPEIMPWDFIMEEYNNLKESLDIIGKLAQKEF